MSESLPEAEPLRAQEEIIIPVDATRISGSIRKIKADKGYGFIAGDNGTDYFFHWTAMKKESVDYRNLQVRDRVEFVPLILQKGPRAVEIQVTR